MNKLLEIVLGLVLVGHGIRASKAALSTGPEFYIINIIQKSHFNLFEISDCFLETGYSETVKVKSCNFAA